jgi:hypothetical protein
MEPPRTTSCAERVQRVLEDVVLDDLEVGDVEASQVAGVDVGRDDLPLRPDLFGQPGRHRATAGADLQTAPARLDQ